MEPGRLALAIRRVIRSRRDLRLRGGARRTMYVARRTTMAPCDGALVPSSPPPTPASPTPPTQSPGGAQGADVRSPPPVAVGSPRPVAVGSQESVALGSTGHAVGSQGGSHPDDVRTSPPSSTDGPALAFLVVTRSAGVDNGSTGGVHVSAGENSTPSSDRDSESIENFPDSVDESEEEEDDTKIASDCSCGECEDLRLAARDDMRVQMEAAYAGAAAPVAAQTADGDDVEEYTPATPEYTPGAWADGKGKQVIIDISDDDDV